MRSASTRVSASGSAPSSRFRRVANSSNRASAPALSPASASPRNGFEGVGIELDGAGRHAHLGGIRLEAAPGGLAQHADRLVERVARVLFGLVRPQEPDEMLAGPEALRRSGEIDEQGEILFP